MEQALLPCGLGSPGSIVLSGASWWPVVSVVKEVGSWMYAKERLN